MTEPTRPALLSADKAARLTDFARACKAAARAVSLYPTAHPAIRLSLGRLVESAARATATGAFNLSVQSGTLAVEGARLEKPDPAVSELAELLRRHLIGGLAIQSGSDADSWRALLLLLARTPEEVRADGGIAHLWAAAGGPSIEIREIDYAEVLRERAGDAVDLDEVVSACIKGAPLAEWDEATRRTLLAMLADPERLAELASRLVERTENAASRSAAFLTLLRHVGGHVATLPHEVDPAFDRLATVAGTLSADTLATVLGQRDSPSAMVGGMNVVGAVVDHMTDDTIADFVAGSIIEEHGATARLAEAFEALVPEVDRKRQVLGLAEQKVADSPLGQEEHFGELWTHVEGMLTSYTDQSYVTDDYAQELSTARTHALDVEQTSDDPPERIAGWLSTVDDSAVRQLDIQLLLDLLAVEASPAKWRDLAETVVAYAQDLARVGVSDVAWPLLERIVDEAASGREAIRRQHAEQALERLGRSPLIGQAATDLRGSDEARVARFVRLCHAIGPSAIPTLAELLSTEQHAGARRHLRDTLVGFGARGRDAVQQLMSAKSWEVRRTAAYLLREFGGTGSLTELEPLLSDAEPLVQREAVQAIGINGNEAAYVMLLGVLTKGPAQVSDAIAHQLRSLRDQRAAPLFCYLVRALDRRAQRPALEASLEALGTMGGPDVIEALDFALRQGEWWAPFRTRALRAMAAAALRRIGTPDARDVLQRLANTGSRGVRAAARKQLDSVSGG